MKMKDFDFYLPKDLIAQYPLKQRDESRLMVVNKVSGEIEHKIFYKILDYLKPGDGLVINKTKVFPARLYGKNEKSNSEIEILLLKEKEKDIWDVLVRPGREVPSGAKIIFNEDKLRAEVLDKIPSGGRFVKFFYDGDFFDIINQIGVIPLPPYIDRKAEPEDKTAYQTVFAEKIGAVAGPTAGFHFTQKLLDEILNKGVQIIPILLHVGLGTFRPIKVDQPEKHRMEPEYFEIEKDSASMINQIKKESKKIVGVGTSTVRALETAVNDGGLLEEKSGWTNMFIYPPYDFKVVDSIITNFHLPKSTLLLLVSAFAGRELILKAYAFAIENKYRFYSYGDAMLLF
jgi:S-adenosylmethionine:tRNA ribosyltransferase-isomerase